MAILNSVQRVFNRSTMSGSLPFATVTATNLVPSARYVSFPVLTKDFSIRSSISGPL